MLLKKQTVWLLTMLSLVVVLSVYYVTSPEGQQEDLAFDQEQVTEENAKDEAAADEEATDEGAEEATDEGAEEATEGGEVTIEEAEDGSIISSVSSDELFTALRMEIDESRSKIRSQLTSKVASKDISTEERNQAYEEMRELEEVSTKENIIEMLIKGQEGYEDALVRAEGDQVKITVKSAANTPTEANKIIRLVRSEISDLQNVAVTFEPAE
jgi:stage III sporulation protein AH